MRTGRNFYYLGSPLRLRPDASVSHEYGKIEWYRKFKSADAHGRTYEPIRCNLDPRHNRGGRRIGNLPGLALETSHKSDFIWTWLGECVIASQVLDLFNIGNLTGFETLPARIEKMRGKKAGENVPFPEVWELVVTGKGGDAHPDSGIRLLYSCPECGYTRYSSFSEGVFVDDQQWDGTDFFKINGYPNLIIITERVKDLIVENKLTNCAVIRTEDLRWGNIPRPEDHPENFVPSAVSIKPLQKPAS